MNRMLKTIIIAMILISIISGCKKEDPVNKLPTIPDLIEPLNGVITGFDAINFKWQCKDPEGDEVKFTFFISKDSMNWNEISFYEENTDIATLNLSSTVPLDNNNYYSFKKSQKYYWKVKAENFFPNGEPNHESGESVSKVNYFYTSPGTLSEIHDSSGHQYVNLYWTDPENIDHVEITFEPKVNSINQPIMVNAGIEKAELRGFENGTIYSFYLRAADKHNHYSETDSVKALPLLPTLIHDADFNTYGVVKIGNQTWMAENLRTTRWQDKTIMIDEYDNILYKIGTDINMYGYYYPARVTIGGIQRDKNPCPCGYHVPTVQEFITLEKFLGLTDEEIENYTYPYILGENEAIGNLLKSTTGWDDYEGNNGNGTDLYGFNLPPAGLIEGSEVFSAKKVAYLWTSTGDGYINKARMYSNSYKGVRWTQLGGTVFFSIRCLKDE